MKRGLTIVIALTTLLVGCSKDADVTVRPNPKGVGNIRISVASDDMTRADRQDDDKIYLNEMYPDWNDRLWEQGELEVVLTSENEMQILDEYTESYTKTYSSIEKFNDAEEILIAADDYLFTVKLASPAEKRGEGLRKPCFDGSESGIRVLASTENAPRTTDVNIKVNIVNSVVKFSFSENFRKYFDAAELTFRSAAGFESTIVYDSENDPKFVGADTYYWINPGSFTLSGTVTRKSPGTGLAGAVEEIETSYTVEAGHCCNYKIDISNVGNVAGSDGKEGINIVVDEKIVDAKEKHSFELNPDATQKQAE